MNVNENTGTITYTAEETEILCGENDMKRDDLTRELQPIIQAEADRRGQSVDVYYNDGVMADQVWPRD